MRVADKMNYEQVKSSLGKNRTDMANLQNQAATMKRITKPSDDPVGATRVLAARTDRTVSEQYIKNLNMARSFLGASEQALSDISDSLVRAKELALSQVNDASANEGTRRTTAAEVDQLYRHVVNVGNRKMGDRFLFGGFKTTTTPFDVTGDYKGDEGDMQIEVNKGVYVPVNLTGAQVFHGLGLYEAPAWSDEKKVERSIQNPETHEFREGHDEGHDEGHVEGHEAGPEIRAPSSVQDPGGKLDVRNSKLEVADTPDNVGNSHLETQNGVNIFNVMKELETGLRSGDKRTIQNTLDTLDQAIQQVIVARSRIGARLMNLDAIDQTLRKSNIEAKTLESRTEDADVYELFTDLSKTENTLKASLSTSGKLIQPSLLDFLR